MIQAVKSRMGVTCNRLTWEEEGSMVITTSLDSETSSGDCFVGIPSSENFFIEFSFLIWHIQRLLDRAVPLD
jgi:hypothetical protein